jgi:serine/threonine protein kinase
MELGGPSLFDVLHNRAPPAAPGLSLVVAGACAEGIASQSGPPDLVQRLHWALGVARALAYLHSRRPVVMHRDVKSQNVVVAAPVGGGGAEGAGLGKKCARRLWSCKLTDFGLVGTRETVAGTPAYMAPELMAAKPFGKAVDAYAFGVLLWELLEGRVPFARKRPDEIKERVLRGERPCGEVGGSGGELLSRDALGVLAGKGGAGLEAAAKAGRLVSRCWAQRAADRPDMAAVALELEALVEQARGGGALESGRGPVQHDEIGVQMQLYGSDGSSRQDRDHIPYALDVSLARKPSSKLRNVAKS